MRKKFYALLCTLSLLLPSSASRAAGEYMTYPSIKPKILLVALIEAVILTVIICAILSKSRKDSFQAMHRRQMRESTAEPAKPSFQCSVSTAYDVVRPENIGNDPFDMQVNYGAQAESIQNAPNHPVPKIEYDNGNEAEVSQFGSVHDMAKMSEAYTTVPQDSADYGDEPKSSVFDMATPLSPIADDAHDTPQDIGNRSSVFELIDEKALHSNNKSNEAPAATKNYVPTVFTIADESDFSTKTDRSKNDDSYKKE